MARYSLPCIARLKEAIARDENIGNFRQWCQGRRRSARKGTARYLWEKVPIAQWLPGYSPSWLVNDVVAGLTIGCLLVPQSLAYANIAKLPAAYGLLSSWLPMLIYTFMGTSKDIQTGPTAINALLTGAVIVSLQGQGYSGPSIAAAVTFMVGVYGAAFGLFKLGFLLDFISAPVLAGYVSAAGLTICLQQVPNFFAEGEVRSGTAEIIRDIFARWPHAKWRDFVVGFTGLLALAVLQQAGKRWGKRSRALWFTAISRNAIIIILYTGISYALNRDRPENPLFAISKTVGTVIPAPDMPDTSLLGQVSGGAIAVFVAAALEHLAVGKAFGRRHGYEIDQSQELLFVGVANLAGSFFSAMPVTGGFSRTAVNSESGVKSPLGGIVTSACVLVSIYKLSGAFYWIPKATLSAVIVSAVWAIIVPPRVFYSYWKTSLADFVASMVSFWVTLFVSVETGIAAAVGFDIACLLLRTAFTGATHVHAGNATSIYADLPAEAVMLDDDGFSSQGTQRFRIGESILFANAYRVKAEVMGYVKALTRGVPSADVAETDRLWNQPRRREEWVVDPEAGDDRPLLRQVILDMTAVNHIDATGIQALMDLKNELRDYAGHSVVVFVGMNGAVKRRFERARWALQKSAEVDPESGELVFGRVQMASSSLSLPGLMGGAEESKNEPVKTETFVEHVAGPSSGDEDKD